MALRTKCAAKANEDKDIIALLALLNNPVSTKGQELRTSFQETFNTPCLAAQRPKKVGGRAVHYDFQIQIAPDKWLNVEHKGSTKYSPISPTLPPWTGGVQFYNGGMEKYRFARRYAEAWYHKYVGSGLLKEHYSLKASIPSLEEWIAKDAKTQGKPKTPFGQELKATYQSIPGNEKKSLTAERDVFVAEFFETCGEEDRRSLAEDILPLVQESLHQKDVWLQVAGDVESGIFHFKWSLPLRVNHIESVAIEKGKDIELRIQCNDGFGFGGILRWGYGAGFSNIRLDLR